MRWEGPRETVSAVATGGNLRAATGPAQDAMLFPTGRNSRRVKKFLNQLANGYGYKEIAARRNSNIDTVSR